MKVILINPDVNKKMHKGIHKFVTPIPLIGLAYIGAVLKKNGIEVCIIDQLAKKWDSATLLQKIEEEEPQIVGFSCLTPTINVVRKLAKGIKQINKNIKIVLGNTHASVFSDELLKEKVADIIVRGEGEISMLEVAQAIREKKRLQHIAGISFTENGSIYHNPDRELIDDIDSFPYPAWELFNLADYQICPLIFLENSPTLVVQASRGCFFNCTYCSQEKIFRNFRYRKVNKVINEMESVHNSYNVSQFTFIDANFPFSKDYGLEFCNKFIRRKLHKKIRWVTETRVDLVDFELLKRMKEAGVHLIMYGFESGNQKVLDSLNKGTTLEQARKTMQYTRELGIYTLGLFMLGMPGETKQTCKETISFAKELDCDVVKFNIAVPLPGSKFFEENKARLYNEPPEKFTSWSDWAVSSGDLLYVPEGMEEKELKNLQRKGMFQFYMRPKLILRHIINRTISLRNLIYGGYVLITSYLKCLR